MAGEVAGSVAAAPEDPFDNGPAPPAVTQVPGALDVPEPALVDAALTPVDVDAGGASGESADTDAAVDAEVGDAGDAAPPASDVEPGALFAACSGNGDCNEGLLCTVNPALGVASGVGYCTALCDLTLATGCQQPDDGMVTMRCTGVGLCVLESCERALCPAAMSCVRTEVQLAPGFPVGVFECKPP